MIKKFFTGFFFTLLVLCIVALLLGAPVVLIAWIAKTYSDWFILLIIPLVCTAVGVVVVLED